MKKAARAKPNTAYYGSQGRSPTLTIMVRKGGSPKLTITQQR